LQQTTANYLVSQLAVWEIDFPGGISNDNVKWRAFIWAISEGLFILAIAINYLPPKLYSIVFRIAIGVMMLDFLLCLIWLPIGVSRTYGFRSAREVFTGMCMSSPRTLDTPSLMSRSKITELAPLLDGIGSCHCMHSFTARFGIVAKM